MPRITRAQSMDALSSMATIAGYKAVLMAADGLPRMFPMLMTAAGTVAPARVLVIGAGVAGLQAIATARRLGAVVSGYDIRAAVKEQIESLGARFVVLDVEGGRRRRQGRLRQGDGRGVLPAAARTAGRRAGRAERGDHHRRRARQEGADSDHARDGGAHGAGLGDRGYRGRARRQLRTDAPRRDRGCTAASRILGPLNLPSTIPYHASQMYAKNIATFLKYLVKDGKLALNREDEIVRETLVTHGGEVVHPRVREMHGTAAAAV